MKILSIDFDFFQNVTTEDISSYPDGVDNTTAISEMVWASHYAMHGEHLNSIDIMHDEFDMLKDILKKQKTSIPVMVTNSHKHIYDFIYSLLHQAIILPIRGYNQFYILMIKPHTLKSKIYLFKV